jgi:hypothetical protein
MEQFAIGANLEGAAARGNQGERVYALAELKNFGRQTDGLRRVVSNNAVFDRYLGLHRQSSFPSTKLSMRAMAVKKCAIESGAHSKNPNEQRLAAAGLHPGLRHVPFNNPESIQGRQF